MSRYHLGSIGVFAIPFTLNVELVGIKYKTIVGLLYQTPFALGEMVVGALAIGVRDYRLFHTALAIPCFAMLGLYFIIPESPRWLINKKRYKEAQKVIKSAAKFNKVSRFPPYFILTFVYHKINLLFTMLFFSKNISVCYLGDVIASFISYTRRKSRWPNK